jgi:poly-beta-1,6-N-acetyl-D-glucosamine synthase
MNRYLAITPAKDAEKCLPSMIESLANQSVTRARWILIDDGSTDATASIIDRAAQLHPWIEPHHLVPKVLREEGGESVIMQFLPRETWEQYDYILRLDVDISFGAELAEGLMAEFVRHPSLGIAGPTLYEPDADGWHEILAPGFHTRGAAKFYSRACFGAIGGLESGPEWDTIDEVRAMMLGLSSPKLSLSSCLPILRRAARQDCARTAPPPGEWRTELATRCCL